MAALEDALREAAEAVDAALNSLVPARDGANGRLFEAMRYSLFAGGKRLRPFLVLSSADLFDVPRAWSANTAAAIEMVHTYSLVHDDLPAMDDDDLRRGKPTCHIAFDEATAILVGDSLLTPRLRGGHGTVGPSRPGGAGGARLRAGARRRRRGHGRRPGDRPGGGDPGSRPRRGDPAATAQDRRAVRLLLRGRRHPRRRGRRGPRCAARLCRLHRARVSRSPTTLLDHEGSEADLGKAVGKDAAAGKATFVGLLGADEARRRAEALVEDAIAALAPFDDRAAPLRAVARYIVERHH